MNPEENKYFENQSLFDINQKINLLSIQSYQYLISLRQINLINQKRNNFRIEFQSEIISRGQDGFLFITSNTHSLENQILADHLSVYNKQDMIQ